MLNITMDINGATLGSLTSTTQNLNAASKIDMVVVSTQHPVTTPLPRIPGFGAADILHVAPDFDASLDLPQPDA